MSCESESSVTLNTLKRSAVVSLAAAFAVTASATTMEAMSPERLTVAAEGIVRGKVIRQAARWNSDHSRIVTDTEIQVIEVLRPHESIKPTIVTMQPGGEVGDVGQAVAGTPTFSLGEEVVVFLESRGDRYIIAGMAQGKYSIDPQTQMATPQLEGLELLDRTGKQVVARVEALPLKELRRRIIASLPPTSTVPPTLTKPKVPPASIPKVKSVPPSKSVPE